MKKINFNNKISEFKQVYKLLPNKSSNQIYYPGNINLSTQREGTKTIA